MKMYTYEDLVGIVAKLRGENGCPWDREQTHETLIAAMLEESYEVVEAIRNHDVSNLEEELGDVLLQVLMHAQIAKESGAFTLDAVVDGIARKLVYRHPHVFETTQPLTSDEVEQNWEVLKQKEKKQATQTEAMEQVPKALPALIRAQKVQKKALPKTPNETAIQQSIQTISAHTQSLQESLKIATKEELHQEIGDLLFSIVNLSYFLEINPEFALTNSTEKFINRFRYIEKSGFAQNSLNREDLTEVTPAP